jgi:hypothetical protein
MSSSQTLTNQFNSLLQEYQSTYKSFVDNINSSDSNASENLILLPDFAYNGGNTIDTITNSSTDTCKTSCSSNSKCTGATYSSDNNNCTLTSDKGSLINSSGSTAIVNKSLYYSYKLQQLNTQLMDINNQMSQSITDNSNGYSQSLQQGQQADQDLQQNYNVLAQERKEIERMILDFKTINSAEENGEINVTMYYYNYIVLILITILLIFLLIKFSVIDQQQKGGGSSFKTQAMFLFGLMMVFLGLSQIYKRYDGYVFFSIIVFCYIIAKLKLISMKNM